jgi:hypothetical protein
MDSIQIVAVLDRKCKIGNATERARAGGMKKREKIKSQRLEQLEAAFRPLLISCLEECARGRYGLFGQNEHFGNWWRWDEAERLKEMAREIIEIRSEYGEQSIECERLLHYCSLRGPHVVGEPKLAQQFLNEIQSQQRK